eukprot:CAMPEP_0168356362 /NCGR_PEP_ID=MMETSP0213-20121227/25104_1 /TAXON_ID=151035 /ORGANISM="Euplotes harpa, Strain FSP1.4" /LENGTH=133 /DNA_ID=CAMNT_0008368755 /DNA_START=183 /DNA_END=585 /DNA_ORIENTATION=-
MARERVDFGRVVYVRVEQKHQPAAELQAARRHREQDAVDLVDANDSLFGKYASEFFGGGLVLVFFEADLLALVGGLGLFGASFDAVRRVADDGVKLAADDQWVRDVHREDAGLRQFVVLEVGEHVISFNAVSA